MMKKNPMTEFKETRQGEQSVSSRDSGNDYRVPEIALFPVCFHSIFLNFSSVVSDQVDIGQVNLLFIC